MAALVDSDKGSGTLNAFRSRTCGPRDVIPEVPSPPHAVEVRVFLKGLESLSQKFRCDWPALSSFREAVGRRGVCLSCLLIFLRIVVVQLLHRVQLFRVDFL